VSADPQQAVDALDQDRVLPEGHRAAQLRIGAEAGEHLQDAALVAAGEIGSTSGTVQRVQGLTMRRAARPGRLHLDRERVERVIAERVEPLGEHDVRPGSAASARRAAPPARGARLSAASEAPDTTSSGKPSEKRVRAPGCPASEPTQLRLASRGALASKRGGAAPDGRRIR
jgi:hypothetical protein